MKKSIIVFRQNQFFYIEGIEEPKEEKYGWHNKCGFDDEPSGWMFEGGEEAYYEAHDKFLNRLKTEGVEVVNIVDVIMEFNEHGKPEPKDLDFIQIDSNQVDIKEGKCYLV